MKMSLDIELLHLNNNKTIFIMKLIAIFLLLISCTLSAQHDFYLNLQMKDTARSVFTYDRYTLESNIIPYSLNLDTAEFYPYHIRKLDTLLYDVRILFGDNFKLEVRIDSLSNWIDVIEMYYTKSLGRTLVGDRFHWGNNLNFRKMYLDSILDFELFRYGRWLDFRFKYNYEISTNLEGVHIAYTNIEKVYIPPYTTADSIGLALLRPVKKKLSDGWELISGNEDYDIAIAILDNCDGSVLHDQAEMNSILMVFSEVYDTGDQAAIALSWEARNTSLRNLANKTKSDYLKERINQFLRGK
jgi:hypothetical protein